MNKTEKIGLIEFITGVVFLAVMFVLGHGDATAAQYPSGEPMPVFIAVAMLAVGALLFFFGDR